MQLDYLGKDPSDKWEIWRMAHKLMADIKINLNETGYE